jgi:hypothetical protein
VFSLRYLCRMVTDILLTVLNQYTSTCVFLNVHRAAMRISFGV